MGFVTYPRTCGIRKDHHRKIKIRLVIHILKSTAFVNPHCIAETFSIIDFSDPDIMSSQEFKYTVEVAVDILINVFYDDSITPFQSVDKQQLNETNDPTLSILTELTCTDESSKHNSHVHTAITDFFNEQISYLVKVKINSKNRGAITQNILRRLFRLIGEL